MDTESGSELLRSDPWLWGGLLLVFLGSAVPATVRVGDQWAGGLMVGFGLLLLVGAVLGALSRHFQGPVSDVHRGYTEVARRPSEEQP